VVAVQAAGVMSAGPAFLRLMVVTLVVVGAVAFWRGTTENSSPPLVPKKATVAR
jgi:hypothetical protein